MRTWNEWPEVVRWALLLPAVLCAVAGVGLGLGLLGAVRGEGGYWLAQISVSAVVSVVLFRVVFALAPRAKVAVGWVFFISMVAIMGAILLLIVTRGLGIAGLIPSLPPPPGETWGRRDWVELGQALTWIVCGTASFRICLREFRAPTPGAPTITAPR